MARVRYESSKFKVPTSIFTQIINGEQPAYKIFEDEYSCAFLSRDAIRLGHTLIVPKIEVDYFVEVPEPFYQDFGEDRAIHGGDESAATA